MSAISLPFQRFTNWFGTSHPDPRSRALRYIIASSLVLGLLGATWFRAIYNDASILDALWVLISFLPNTEGILQQVKEPVLYTGVGAFHASVYYRLQYAAWPLAYCITIVFSLISVRHLRRHRFTAASYSVLLMFCVLTAWEILFIPEMVLPTAMCTMLIAGLMLSTRSLWIVWVVLVVIGFFTALLRQSLTNDMFWLTLNILKLCVFLTVELLLLYAFRVEFDARANAWEKARIAELEQERLLELDKHKTQFLHSMSHDLRTPLHSIIGLSTSILNGVAGEIDKELYIDVETIRDSGKHLLYLVNGLLDLAKIESGSMKLDKRFFDLVPVINDALRIVESQMVTKGLSLINAVPAQLPLVYADPQATQQILLNLLNNAVKFTPQGCVEVTTKVQQDSVVVCVKDSGIGISPEHQQKIFDKFYQIAGHYRNNETGLGLTISKSLVELQGGEIWVQSVLNEGSTFAFSLSTNQ